MSAESENGDYDVPTCPVCGADMDWIDCLMRDGKGRYLHEANPEPDTPCRHCEGRGGWWVCPCNGTKQSEVSQ